MNKIGLRNTWKAVIRATTAVLDYSLEQERKSWVECGKPRRGHIYPQLCLLQNTGLRLMLQQAASVAIQLKNLGPVLQLLEQAENKRQEPYCRMPLKMQAFLRKSRKYVEVRSDVQGEQDNWTTVGEKSKYWNWNLSVYRIPAKNRVALLREVFGL